MLAGTFPHVTCASGPNHSNVLRSESSTLFLFHLLHGTDAISVDFIVELPQSAGHDSIMVIVDSITKCTHFISTVTTISAAGAAHLFLNHVWKHHGLPWKVISNRGPQFIAEFTWELYRLLGIKLAATTAYHPQGDGQTECVNQELEQYLRLFTKDKMIGWGFYLSWNSSTTTKGDDDWDDMYLG